jgi:hypothetical protein
LSNSCSTVDLVNDRTGNRALIRLDTVCSARFHAEIPRLAVRCGGCRATVRSIDSAALVSAAVEFLSPTDWIAVNLVVQ